MKTLTTVLALLPLGVNGAPGQAIRETSPHPIVPSTRIQLVATIDEADLRPGKPIIVNLLLKNISSDVVTIGDSSPDFDFDFTVTDTSGKEPLRTDRGNKLLQHWYPILHSDSPDLEPGQEWRKKTDLAKIYQLDQPGTYYMRVVFHAIFSKTVNGVDVSSIDISKRPAEEAFSNTVRFTIVP